MTRRPTQAEITVSAAEQIEELQDQKELATLSVASEFLTQFKGMADVRVKVLRRSVDTGKWEYVRTFPPDVLDSDYIRRNFGPGSYKLIVMGPKTDAAPQGYYG